MVYRVSQGQSDLQIFDGGDPPGDISKQIGCHAHPAQIKGLDPAIGRVLDRLDLGYAFPFGDSEALEPY